MSAKKPFRLRKLETWRNTMRLWWKLAWIEWRRSFLWSKSSKPDFFWLTMLLALTLSLALLVYGSREGLLNRFMDVSLGYVKDAGIPIWIVAKVDDEGRVMDRELLESLDYNIHPYRLVEWDQVSLPRTIDGKTDLWQAEQIAFKGWAVSADDPLWKGNKTTALPLEIILSKSLFKQYFQCEAYENALKDKLPNFKTQAASSDKLYCLANKQLWLEVNTRRGRELMPFSINWAKGRIPTMEELAFLFPISTFSALKEAKYSPQLNYYPEAEGASIQRIKTLMFWQDQENESLRDNLTDCLLAKDNTPRNQIIPKQPLPLKWVKQCAELYKIPLQTDSEQLLTEPYLSIGEFIEGHKLSYNNGYLSIISNKPCEEIVPAWKRYAKKGHATCSDTKATADMLTMIGGYQQGFIYTERDMLFQHLKDLKTISRTENDPPALSPHPTYHNALIRFDFIDKIMQLLNSIYSQFFLLFIVVLLIVQIGIVIQHRQHEYGIFLAKGMSWNQLHLILYIQIILSFLVATILTIGAIIMMRNELSAELSIISKIYENSIQIGDLQLLPLLWGEYGIVSAIILAIAFLIAMLFLIIKQIRFGQQAAHLF